ncbi:TetR/AcrR family transcriptional regulator [Blastococcus sp. MG754426]|uniref:TetR/AcrR family transcriptional regulator n=1 Tax=unclassified Blastococcus TaxID=2619396 RepID=UPI001EEFAFBE|nr:MULTISPECIES: TetR/AcrR family transcriptional regulator [unclassified Blastococcus]MCF6508291.1 TetR/AcrR family transcriptional regulator [Blastococcus sp. MG754426]MCF6512990.1 TetR/AcrR family transcriptional regulator [Blastococcus sp. MG754427]
MPTAATDPPVAGRGRRAPRPSGDDRELAILATAERLLADRPLAAISVDDLARGAGISRPTFYFYFSSKDAVLLALLDRVVAEADTAMRQVFDTPATSARDGWARAIGAYYETFRAHRALTVAWAQARSTSDEVRELWSSVVERWVQRSAAAIDAERSRGAAPPGTAARDLAVALTSMNERVLYATFSGDGPAVAEQDVVEVLLGIWLAAVYGTPAPG